MANAKRSAVLIAGLSAVWLATLSHAAECPAPVVGTYTNTEYGFEFVVPDDVQGRWHATLASEDYSPHGRGNRSPQRRSAGFRRVSFALMLKTSRPPPGTRTGCTAASEPGAPSADGQASIMIVSDVWQ